MGWRRWSFLLCLLAPPALGVSLRPVGDLNADRKVDFKDLRLLSNEWLSADCEIPGCEGDLDGGGGVRLADFAWLAGNWRADLTTPVINEFMASNGSRVPLAEGDLLDADGDSSDWVELYNPTSRTFALGGWYLTDDPTDLTKWRFPNGTTIAPDGYLVVFASGKNRAGGQLHTNFRLAADGGYLALVTDDGETVAHEYGPSYPSQLTDIAYGLGQYHAQFVTSQSEASFHVPGPEDAGRDWTAVNFDDHNWPTGPASLGFSQTSQLTGRDIGSPSLAGTYTVPGAGVFLVHGDGADIGGTADSFYYLYTPLKGDGEITARVMAVVNTNAWAKAGVMIRETLAPGSRHAMEVVTPSSGTAFQRRTANNGSSSSTHGNGFRVPQWVRITRRGNKFSGYYSPDGVNWTQQGTEAIGMAQDVYIGLCVTAHADGVLCTGVFDNVTFGSQTNNLLRDEMLGTNASVWMRVAFDAEETGFFDLLRLEMRYEDGFVAFLNGVEVARDNVTGAPQWNSPADRDRPDALMGQPVVLDISRHRGLLRDGRNVLAVQGLNDGTNDPTFLMAPEFWASGEVRVPQYLVTATPGRPNISGAVGVVADPRFSHPRGLYDGPFTLALSCDTPGAVIRYTTDGRPPTETSGRVYGEPITVYSTMCLRAAAFKPGFMPSAVDTHTYILVDEVLHQSDNPPGFPTMWGSTQADYEMDPDIATAAARPQIAQALKAIPTLSLVMDLDDLFGADGIYTNWNSSGDAWERPGSIELMYPDGSGGFHENCGVRIYGGVGRREKKKSFRLQFTRNYGATKLRYPLFGADAADTFDQLVLRANFNDGYPWGGNRSQFIRDEYVRRLQLALGHPSPHGIFVHLYINGVYWGLYNPTERPEASFAATYFGGDKEDWDALNSGRPLGSSTTQTWNAMLNLVRQGMETNANYQRLQGNNPDGTRNPQYVDYLDIDNYIDYLIVNFFTGNRDWPGHNWYAAMNRVDSSGWKSFSWDAEWVVGMNSGVNDNVTGVNNSLCEPYARLRANPEFCLRFADLAQGAFFNDGLLYVDLAQPQWDRTHPERNRPAALYAELADGVESSILCESARWGDVGGGAPYTIAQWRSQRDWVLNTYMPQRAAIVLDQLRSAGLYPTVDAPVFLVNGTPQNGGLVPSNSQLTMESGGGESIYYTTDGSDPRLPAEISTDSEIVTLVPENAPKRVLVPSVANGGNLLGNLLPGFEGDVWFANPFDDSSWTAGTGGVGYEAGTGDYPSYFSIDVRTQMHHVNGSCYIRIPFTLDGAEFPNMMLKVRYDDGFIAYLNGVEVARRNFTGDPRWNSTATGSNPDDAAIVLTTIDISEHAGLLRPGANLLAIHGLNTSVDSSDFLISVELVAGEISQGAVSPTAIPYAGPVPLRQSTRVKARAFAGRWSALNEAVFAVGPVAESLRVSEIMYHPLDTGRPEDPNAEYIELTNIGTETINLNLVRFTHGIDYTFPGFELPAGGYCLLVKDSAAFEAKYGTGLPVVGRYTGSLDNAGERIELVDASGRTIQRFEYNDDWFDITDGPGFSLTVKDPQAADTGNLDDKSAWRPSARVGGSPGADDSGQVPELGTVVINELLANSQGVGPDWIELHNTTNQAINIGGWFLSDDADDLTRYEIAEGTSIVAGGYLVLYENRHFGNGIDPGCKTAFALSADGETVYLHSGSNGILTGYSEQERFGASDPGVSLGRWQKSTRSYDFVALSEPTPDRANAYPQVGPVVINEIMYHPAGSAAAEYVELLNISDSPVTLYDAVRKAPWRFTTDPDQPTIELLFPAAEPVTLAPGECLLLAADAGLTSATYGIPAHVKVLAWGPGNLADGTDKVQLSRPGDREADGTRYWIRVDRIVYSDGAHSQEFPEAADPWPVEADGAGQALSRVAADTYGNDPPNWKAAPPSPGRANP